MEHLFRKSKSTSNPPVACDTSIFSDSLLVIAAPSSIMPPERKLDNAGKRLGQWVELRQPFAALWLPISLWGVAPVNGLAL